MSTVTQTLLGIALVTIGAVLALTLPDHEWGWFRGQPLGVVLVVLGVVDLVEVIARRR
ncbi:hypothetical protein L615_003300000260 [Nocardioides sp. J9]|uniref:hypothetical protein n=1 Tax=unclassified Nocardioides TaxID=2615069 RepID=UPI0004B804F1|nr:MULTISPECIES: hypothetical protein [unclassified Nocardioides]TWG97833.1 hypothetical protein L615_003300000260 [Nocardioides sp. J9]